MDRTEYVLHGGYRTGEKQTNDAFFRAVLENVPQTARVLIVYFATDNGDKYFPEDIEQFEKNSGGRELIFEKANEEEFEVQVKKADVIYLHGGSSVKILEKMKKYENFGNWLEGKVVAGDSAGGNVLSTVFYSKRNGVMEGMGILPVKFIPHFEEENRSKLDEVGKEIELVSLPEYKFKKI